MERRLQAGATYFLDASWFLDFNYTFAMTQQFSNTYSASFTNSFMLNTKTYTTSGVANLLVTDRLTTQTVGISLNNAF